MPYIPRPSFPGSIGYSSYNKQNFGDQETENSNPGAATAAQTDERSATLSSSSSSSCVCSPFCVFLLLPFFAANRRVWKTCLVRFLLHGDTATDLHQNYFSSMLIAYFHPITLPPLFVWPDFIQVYISIPISSLQCFLLVNFKTREWGV